VNKSQILEFIQNARVPVTKRDIARAFNIKGGNSRIELKQTLKELEDDGVIRRQSGAYTIPDGLPGVCTIEVSDIDIDGDVFAKPVNWDTGLQGPCPRIEVMPGKKGHPAVKPGDRALARLTRTSDKVYEAHILKRLDIASDRIIGQIRATRGGFFLVPADKKIRDEFEVPEADLNGAKANDLVVGEIQPGKQTRRKKARITEVIGARSHPKAISLLSMHEMGLRPDFPPQVVAATQGLSVPSPEGREDLRNIPLVTIDGSDARDFDDAVFAQKDGDGHHLIVAIADVAYYVRTETPLDREAQRRGNSTYFPDRVVPMLPEALSNDLCSLRPHEDRACLAVHLWIDGSGKLLRYKFVRALMRSTARLTYEQVQAARNGLSDDVTGPLEKPVIAPLYEAFEILDKARKNRGALELDLPERQVIIDEKGNMTGVRLRQRLDSHRLIEEFMIMANVAAALALEARKAPCAYRVHSPPNPEKLASASEFLESFGLSLPKGQAPKPAQINQILLKAAELPYSHLISQVVLRAQSQAHYSSNNDGHFGLALRHYAHFTSPIRRYSDLLVHRSLIAAYGLGPGGLDQGEAAQLEAICDHISQTERISMEAERNSIDRFTAAFLSEKIGAQFEGRVTGVTRFGLFVELNDTGADGLVPMRSLPHDFYIHDERAHALIGRRFGRIFRLGAPVTVRLMEADGLTGSTLLNLVGHDHGADIPGISLKTPSYSPRGPQKRDKGRDGDKHGRGKARHKKKRPHRKK
jgi:ribonuclease R